MMKKKIFIVSNKRGWAILSDKGERLAGHYESPNHALKIARPLAAAQNAEIVIFSRYEPFLKMLDERNKKSLQRKETEFSH